MKVEEQSALVSELMQNLNDQAKASTILATLSEDYVKVNAELTTAKLTAEKAEAEKEQLRQANMTLMLKIPQGTKAEERKEQLDTKPKFEALFDKEGNLL